METVIVSSFMYITMNSNQLEEKKIKPLETIVLASGFQPFFICFAFI